MKIKIENLEGVDALITVAGRLEKVMPAGKSIELDIPANVVYSIGIQEYAPEIDPETGKIKYPIEVL